MTTALAKPEWDARRRTLRNAVREAVYGVDSRMRIRGSFVHGDFHLARDGRVTFSDVDLLIDDDGRSPHAWEADVAAALASRGWDIRISVLHFDPTLSMERSASSLLSFGQLIRFLPKTHDRRFEAYLLSKTALGVLGVPGIAARSEQTPCGDDRVRAAWLARIGFEAGFDRASCIDLLLGAPEPNEITAAFVDLMRFNDRSAARAWFLDRLERSTAHPWMKDHYHEVLQES
ncbi:hypothetical protein [Mycobacterium sp. ITM-2016-00318]|uniref:hypothetical protein n=1 Tax=Mycobacterium sp. ITM-2016-00318 TaxID=2099693 RepID=UPI000CF87302|nr:hypothetical protein [Mycobacterium sp. ITM-2016-00318]WNG94666.1 hypothetical protein C6A82_009695 [Mycobacterium sp. ITM-2016-00318]